MTKTKTIDENKKRTLATTFRGDARTLATLSSYFIDKGEPCRTLSEILRLAIECMGDMVVANDPNYYVPNHTTAIRVLQKHGLLNLAQIKRNRKTLTDQLTLEDVGFKHLRTSEAEELSITQAVELAVEQGGKSELSPKETKKIFMSVPDEIVPDEGGEDV